MTGIEQCQTSQTAVDPAEWETQWKTGPSPAHFPQRGLLLLWSDGPWIFVPGQ